MMPERCGLCGRQCGVNRQRGETGTCGCADRVVIDNWLPHHGEEPPISGTHGSGTIFFSRCPLACVYCQNYQISQHGLGKEYSSEDLAGMMLELQGRGCHNINLVSPTPYVPMIIEALRLARERELSIPIVYNTGGYDRVETLNWLRGLVDIYLPDFKYWDDRLAKKYSGIDRYRDTVCNAILEMQAQVGCLQLDDDGIAQKGVLIRHLVLPGNVAGSMEIIDWVNKNVSPNTYMSIMSQYNPVYNAYIYEEINRPITDQEYQKVINYAGNKGFDNIFVQDLTSANEYLPDFNKNKPFSV